MERKKKSKQTSVHIYLLELPEHEVRDRCIGRRHGNREGLEQVGSSQKAMGLEGSGC